jgi:excinuclease ABC subunit A
MSDPACIRLRGVRQNNLKGFDLDVPLGRYVVVTGLSGAGKSSLVFQTLHAEGQRRYVETFSAYTRQFLELLDKPQVDLVENIRPSIAIEQTNTIKTSRSTVGTMTELCDYFKVWFSHVAQCFDPATGERVEDDTPATIWTKARTAAPGRTVLVAFRVARPANLAWCEILASLASQGYTRGLVPAAGQPIAGGHYTAVALARLEALQADPAPLAASTELFVVQDRLALDADARGRFIEAVETALGFGQGEVFLFGDAPNGAAAASHSEIGHFSRGLHAPKSGRKFRAATPALFSFNSPLGACPRCRGFGRTIEIDWRLAIPDRSLSIDQGAIKPWEGEVYGESKKDLLTFAKKRRIPTHVPFHELTAEQQAFVIEGEPGYGENGREWPHAWYGLKGFFQWLERNTYKMHVRVFLSRYRSYNECQECGGTRLQPESRCWRWHGFTLPELYATSVQELLALLERHAPATSATGESAGNGEARSAAIARDSIVSRLRYLVEVGLGYLTLDRSSRTLSGGEVERVNLTSCLGSSLVDTLFVLDEPSVGLHPRDIDRLIAIVRSLTAAGNTVVVVEHDEAMIRAADHVIEIGPEPGAKGGHIVFQGDVPALLRSTAALTGDYLAGRRRIELPTHRRPVDRATPRLIFRGVTKHNLHNLEFSLPLGRFVCLSGVSGSGKSTLLDHVVHQGVLAARNRFAEDPAVIADIAGLDLVGDVVLVDQSPLSRTPRSNAVLYTEAWELIRELYANTEAAREAGMTASTFSFNSGEGRCDHCAGLGYEQVQMQFLSDVYVPCPLCAGRRFKPEVLAIELCGRSVADLLALTVDEALRHFADTPGVQARLAPLGEVGLGYLTLGQPLNTLSGGEAQRLKLVKFLSAALQPGAAGALLLLDEPTTGLHRHDVNRLLGVLQRLVDLGHSLVVIEHNTDVLKSADWLIEMGPEAGAAGGRIVAEGPPGKLARGRTASAPYLAAALAGDNRRPGEARPLAAEDATLYGNGDRPRAITLVGAREHNLQNLSLSIPHHEFTVVTGVSGSGKSTLAFDIIFAEGQRRFMESMSPYARQFVEQLPRPAIDRLTGIPPTVAIEQRVTRGSRKSTVATITEVAQYLRLLYARVGRQHHPESDRPIVALGAAALRRHFLDTLARPAARRARHLYLCAPLIRRRKGHHQPVANWIRDHGYTLMRADGRLLLVENFTRLDRYQEHDIEVVVADLRAPAARGDRAALAHLATALRLGKGACFLLTPDGTVLSWFSTTRTDAATGEAFPELDPKDFSFNSPKGWCPTCRGHGRILPWMLEQKGNDDDTPPELAELARLLADNDTPATEHRPCPECAGARLNRVSRAVKLHFRRGEPLSLPALLALPPAGVLARLHALALDARGRLVARDILPQIEERLKFLAAVGLDYLTLDRPTETLSGGEAQRIRLAAQLGSNLSGVLYVLDEPSIGLHSRDNDRLLHTLRELKARGNTLLVVEHDDTVMDAADRILDLGPGAGREGGRLLANDTPAQLRRHAHSLTGRYLAQGIPHPLRGHYRTLPAPPGRGRRPAGDDGWITLDGARLRNLRGVDLRVPRARLTMVAGPSGAGKSTLFRDLLHPAVACAIQQQRFRLTGREFLRLAPRCTQEVSLSPAAAAPAAPFDTLAGANGFKAVIEVDQSPIGKTPRSTPATYLGAFDLIRQFFASLPEARVRGYNAGRFSFNTAGGRCERCAGAGRIKLEMSFMPDTYLPCDDCGGRRYGPELADIRWKGLNIGEVLRLTFSEAAAFFDFHAQLREVCSLMVDTGLGYLELGQSSPTLSGGEAQRLKLVTELTRGLQTFAERSRGVQPRHLYLLEEPTIGLHLSDCEKLIHLLHRLVDQGHTVVVIEHHLDLLAEADWLVELGPDGGPGGGDIVYQGPVAGALRARRSPTAPYLRAKLGGRSTRPPRASDRELAQGP